MARILVYEYFSAGGLSAPVGSGDDADRQAMLSEGVAMLAALVQDFAAIERVDVSYLLHADLESLFGNELTSGRRIAVKGSSNDVLLRAAEQSDWTIVIAPETDGVLCDRAKRVSSVARLLSPCVELIQIAGDKNLTHRALAAAGVPTARLWEAAELPAAAFPVIVKPRDGAGSAGVLLIQSPPGLRNMSLDSSLIIESYAAGQPASVAVIGGMESYVYLPACTQVVRHTKVAGLVDCLSYEGGIAPLEGDALQLRATNLARQVIAALPPFVGYLGIDIVLGEALEDDCVIEINPRLTTSYIGLRQVVRPNLAQLMLDLASGKSLPVDDLLIQGKTVRWP